MTEPALPHRLLGSSGISVSVLSLGSWKTYEHIPRDRGLAVMRAALEAGIDFLDDARYNDTTGAAPLRTGWSEVVFGELFRAAGWKRDEVVVANKLWWEFWPDETAALELEGSLGRMGFDYLDLAYAERPPAELGVADVVRALGGLIAAGKLRAWGALNWPGPLLAEVARVAAAEGLPGPAAAQLPYSLVRRTPVEDEETVSALRASGASVVASAVLASGALTGKYAVRGAPGRIAHDLSRPGYADPLRAAESLRALARRLETTPAVLALAFALANPRVASVLFGATRPEQVAENAAAAALLPRLADSDLAELRAIG